MQPSSSTRATIVSAENQNGATIVKAKFFFCHYYIVWESNNAGEARGQSWSESLKSRWIPGGSCSYTSGTKRKHFAALSSPRPCWRWLQLQPSCGSPQWICAHQLTARSPLVHRHPFQYKDHLFRYGDSHREDKTTMGSFYLCEGNQYTGKIASSYRQCVSVFRRRINWHRNTRGVTDLSRTLCIVLVVNRCTYYVMRFICKIMTFMGDV